MIFYKDNYERKTVTFDYVERTNCVVSDMYLFENEFQKQIRFRYIYFAPFMHDTIFDETTLDLINENGEDLVGCISGYPDEFKGFNGVNVQFAFSGEALPQLGEKLSLTMVSCEKREKPYASCKIEIVIP